MKKWVAAARSHRSRTTIALRKAPRGATYQQQHQSDFKQSPKQYVRESLFGHLPVFELPNVHVRVVALQILQVVVQSVGLRMDASRCVRAD